MPTFQKAGKEIKVMADKLLNEFETHKPLREAQVSIDYLFAFADRDEDGNPTNNALSKNGVRALGIARKIPLKERVMGRGDAEITLDHDHWESITEQEQAALLDHELHHISIKVNQHGIVDVDDIGRPKILLRKHDADFGWFKIVAERHGARSIECQQAKSLFDNYGQAFWPEIANFIHSDNRITKLEAKALAR
jgi:hypothetical protein